MRNKRNDLLLATDRLLLRRVEQSDWQSIRKIWEDEKQSKYACYDGYNDTSPEAVRHRIEKWASFRGSAEHMFFAVCLGEIVIGYFSFNIRENGYEIGYCFLSAYHGKGYARESLTALISFVREQYPAAHFTAGAALANIPSVRLLESVGFRLVGTEQVSFYQDASGRDIYFEGGIFELD